MTATVSSSDKNLWFWSILWAAYWKGWCICYHHRSWVHGELPMGVAFVESRDSDFNLDLSFTSCVSLTKMHNLSVPLFPRVWYGDNTLPPRVVMMIESIGPGLGRCWVNTQWMGALKVKVKCRVQLLLDAQSCPTLCDPVDCSPPLLHPWDSQGKTHC